jgi:hypothetical protein
MLGIDRHLKVQVILPTCPDVHLGIEHGLGFLLKFLQLLLAFAVAAEDDAVDMLEQFHESLVNAGSLVLKVNDERAA